MVSRRLCITIVSSAGSVSPSLLSRQNGQSLIASRRADFSSTESRTRLVWLPRPHPCVSSVAATPGLSSVAAPLDPEHRCCPSHPEKLPRATAMPPPPRARTPPRLSPPPYRSSTAISNPEEDTAVADSPQLSERSSSRRPSRPAATVVAMDVAWAARTKPAGLRYRLTERPRLSSPHLAGPLPLAAPIDPRLSMGRPFILAVPIDELSNQP